jgi:hypothetical protein
MNQTNTISKIIKINFYINSINFILFLGIIITGLVIQLNYHMHRLPDTYLIMGMERMGWLLAHKAATAAALIGIIIHCMLHLKYISAATKKFINKASKSPAMTSYYLLIICFFTSITAIISWLFLEQANPLRFLLIEVHDKLALLFIIFSVVHILSRTKWMLKTYQRFTEKRTL